MKKIILLPLVLSSLSIASIMARNFGIQISEFNNKTNRKLMLAYEGGSENEFGKIIGKFDSRKNESAIKVPITSTFTNSSGNKQFYKANLVIIDEKSNEILLRLGLPTNETPDKITQSAFLLTQGNYITINKDVIEEMPIADTNVVVYFSLNIIIVENAPKDFSGSEVEILAEIQNIDKEKVFLRK